MTKDTDNQETSRQPTSKEFENCLSEKPLLQQNTTDNTARKTSNESAASSLNALDAEGVKIPLLSQTKETIGSAGEQQPRERLDKESEFQLGPSDALPATEEFPPDSLGEPKQHGSEGSTETQILLEERYPEQRLAEDLSVSPRVPADPKAFHGGAQEQCESRSIQLPDPEQPKGPVGPPGPPGPHGVRVKAPDGGWGWVIILATVMSHIIYGIMVRSFGVIFLEMMLRYKDSPSATGWIGAINIAACGILGMVTIVFRFLVIENTVSENSNA